MVESIRVLVGDVGPVEADSSHPRCQRSLTHANGFHHNLLILVEPNLSPALIWRGTCGVGALRLLSGCQPCGWPLSVKRRREARFGSMCSWQWPTLSVFAEAVCRYHQHTWPGVLRRSAGGSGFSVFTAGAGLARRSRYRRPVGGLAHLPAFRLPALPSPLALASPRCSWSVCQSVRCLFGVLPWALSLCFLITLYHSITV